MKSLYFAAALLSVSVLAQAQNMPSPDPGRGALKQLVNYLQLTPEQIAKITAANLDLDQFLVRKEVRAAQVNSEIRDETTKDVVDPMALGVRYTELEAICRESRDKKQKTVTATQSVLNTTQQAQLKTLEQAYAMLPLVETADAVNLIDTPLPNLSSSVLQALTGVTNKLPGCKYRAESTTSTGN
jgi:hypothetical protein